MEQESVLTVSISRYKRYNQAEEMEIIKLVEQSDLPVKKGH